MKPPESGELCEEITELVVVEGDLPPPSDESGFILISYKREAYVRPEPQGMLYLLWTKSMPGFPKLFWPY